MSTTLAPVTVPAEPTTPIKPSEALRLGRLLFPRRLTGLFQKGSGACAVGAIEAGTGATWLPDLRAACPAGPCVWWNQQIGVRGVVMHLNDEHLWGDAQIVAWLVSLGL